MKNRLLFYIILILTLTIVVVSGFIINTKPENDRVNENGLIGMNRFNEIKAIGKVIPRRSEEIKNSPWGVQWNARYSDSSLAELDTTLEKMANSGVKWTRVTSDRFYTPAQEGIYDLERMDKIINGLTTRKINIFITINKLSKKAGNSRLLKSKRVSDNVGESMQESELSEYLKAVATLVIRYKNTVKYWEIFNEPTVDQLYANTVVEASKVIKQIDPEAKVLGGSLARNQFSKIDFLINTAGTYMDVLTFHPYNESPEAIKHKWIVTVNGLENDGYNESSMLFNQLLEKLGKEVNRIQLWDGEGGFPSSEHTGSYKGRGPWGENIQAKWLLRRYLINFSLNIPVMIYYYLTEVYSPDNEKVNAKGIMASATGQPKKGYLALQHITSIFDEGLSATKEIQSEFEIIDEGGFTGIKGENTQQYLIKNPPYENAKSPLPIEVVTLTGTNGEAVTYWLPWRMQEYIKPAKINVIIKNVHIKEPVLVDLLTGVIYRVNSEISGKGLLIKDVPLTDYPMAIIPQHLVKMKKIED